MADPAGAAGRPARWRGRLAAPLLAAIVLLGGAPGWAAAEFPLPPTLEPIRAEAVATLGASLGLPPEVAARPVEIDFLPRGATALPPRWAMLPRWAAGGAIPTENRLVVVEGKTGGFPFGSPAQTLRHELAHVLLHRRLPGGVPRWFDEGVALRLSGEWEGGLPAGSLLSGRLGRLSLARLDADFREGEAEARRSYELARGFLAHLFPSATDLPPFLDDVSRRGSFDAAFLLRFGATPAEAFDRWVLGQPLLLRWAAVVGNDGLLLGAGALLFVPLGALLLRRRRRAALETLGPDRDEPPPLRFPAGDGEERYDPGDDPPPGRGGAVN